MNMIGRLLTVALTLLVAGGCGAPDHSQSPVVAPSESPAEVTKPTDFYEEGMARLRQGKAKEAAANLRKQIAANPKDVRSRLVLAEVHLDAKDIIKAQRLLEGAAKDFPNNAEIHLQLAKVYDRIGETRRALDSAQEALVLCHKQRNAATFEKASTLYNELQDKIEKEEASRKPYSWPSRNP